MNPFEALAEQQMVAATKARHRAAERRAAKVVRSERDAPMKLSEAEQAQADQSAQFRAYRRWKRAEVEAVLEPHQEWKELSRLLRALSIENAADLIEYVRAAGWLHGADLKTRQTALSAIANIIIRLRIANGYAPIDDSLPGEPPTVFEIIRKELGTQT
jgi:hypothetical protein